MDFCVVFEFPRKVSDFPLTSRYFLSDLLFSSGKKKSLQMPWGNEGTLSDCLLSASGFAVIALALPS